VRVSTSPPGYLLFSAPLQGKRRKSFNFGKIFLTAKNSKIAKIRGQDRSMPLAFLNVSVFVAFAVQTPKIVQFWEDFFNRKELKDRKDTRTRSLNAPRIL
jgi:hypothetical protein